MTTFFQLITDAFRIFLDIIPRVFKINANEMGIKFGLSDSVKVLKPGVYVFIPIIHDMEKRLISYRNLTLNRQTLITSDRMEVIIESNVFFRIVDIKKFIVDNGNVGEILQSEILGSIKKLVLSSSLDFIVGSHSIEESAISEIKELEENVGIKVEKINIVGISTCFHFNNIEAKAYNRDVI